MGQADDLKYESPGKYRIWLSRCGVADGEPCENKATVEIWLNGKWIESEVYEAPSEEGFREKFGNKRLITGMK